MRILEIDCKRMLEIDLERAHGTQIDPNSMELYEKHLETCDACRMERAVLESMAGDDASGALPQLDDLSRHRFIDDVIAGADKAAFDAAVEKSAARVNRRGIRIVATASALIAASVAAFMFWWMTPSSAILDHPEQIVSEKVPVESDDGRFSLIAGEMFVADNKALLGDGFKSGDALQTRDGRAVVTLETGATLTLGPDTDLRVERTGSATGIFLGSGRIQLNVEPDKKRSGFSVVTNKGRVEVTGTIFSVAVGGDSVEVRVLRGEVELEDERGAKSSLSAGGAAELGSSRSWSLSKEEEKSFWAEVKAVEMLDPSGNAVIEIESEPIGLNVSIDGVFLGATPVSARIRAGYRQLAVAAKDKKVAQELVDIRPGSHLYRNFDLRNVVVEAERGVERRSGDGESASRRGSIVDEQLSAQELLKKAQVLRAERDWQRAAGAYENVVGAYPDSDEARASLVSLGEMQLTKLKKPASALAHFEKYLSVAMQGPLAQEALFGKALALKALSRTDAERDTLNLFLIRFPSAIQAREAKARLSEIAGSKEK